MPFRGFEFRPPDQYSSQQIQMRKGEDIRDEISFDGVDGLRSSQLIQAIRKKAFSEEKHDDSKYMALLASFCLDGPALEWFERLEEDVQTDWILLRRALLARFPATDAGKGSDSRGLTFSGENPKECEDFVRLVQKHSQEEGKTHDDQWMARYAADCMAGDGYKWHAQLDEPIRNSWALLERALLQDFPESPPNALVPAGKVIITEWKATKAPSFLPRDEQTWLQEARKRRITYDDAGPGKRASVYWLLVEDGERIPDTAIQTGAEIDGELLYSAREWIAGGLHPGKCGRHVSGAQIPLGTSERLDVTPYEVLVGDASAVSWIANPWGGRPWMSGKNPPPSQMKPLYTIEGGIQDNGMPFMLAQAHIEGHGWQPGKIGICWQTYGTVVDRKVFYQTECRYLVWA